MKQRFLGPCTEAAFVGFFVCKLFTCLSAQEIPFNYPQPTNPSIPWAKTDAVDRGSLLVDPAIYLLGPGDVVDVRCSKMPWVQYSGIVNESGIFYVPEFGMLQVDKQTLEEAKPLIAAMALKNNAAGNVVVTLHSAKQVEVLVTGEPVRSGSYRLSGSLRVLDAIKAASRDSSKIFSEINMRQVFVSVKDTVLTIDLAKFIAKGDGASNPYLYPRSVVSVTPPDKWVIVSGAVSSALPASIPFRPQETIGEILSLFRFSGDADSANILLIRKNCPPVKYTLARISALPAQNLDDIVVGTQMPRVRLYQVSVKGEVRNPGVYPITPGATTARQIIAIAGGPTELGDTMRIFVRRSDPLLDASATIASGLASVRPETNFSVRQMLSSHDYRVIPLSASTAVLENQDEIFIPAVSRSVYVSGYVKRPGIYPYVSGKSRDYYINQAGGWAENADRLNTKVVEVFDDSWSVKKSAIKAGDVIIVPERQEEKSLRRFQVVMQTLSYAGTIIIALVALGIKVH